METITTVIREVEDKSGKYSVALGNAVALLVEERKNFIPIYMPGDTVNFLEARVIDAARREGVLGEVTESMNAGMEIQAFRGQTRNMLREMAIEWGSPYAYAILLSNDMTSSNPAIIKPEDPRFSFRFHPKKFELGLTGRLLEDNEGKRYQERLEARFDIYDAFNLAVCLSPQTVVAVDSHGNESVVYEDRKMMGETVDLEKADEPIDYAFSEGQLEQCNQLPGRGLKVLPTNGMKVVFSDFYEKIKKYESGSILFGHKYSDREEFLGMTTVLDQHLIWDIIKTQYGGIESSLVDCERVYGLKNQVKSFPEYKNRLQIMDHLSLYLGCISLRFDRPAIIQALLALGDIVADIWFEPIGKRWDQGWDIVYDLRRKISPDRSVSVMGVSNIERYRVLKGFSGQTF